MSRSRDTEYFSDGLTEELITTLSHLPGLTVPGRTSVFVFKHRNEDIRRIGRALNVENVLEGSVRRSGQTYRITAQLIDAADGFHLWSERYDRQINDPFQVQDEVSQQILGALQALFKSPFCTVRREPDLNSIDLPVKCHGAENHTGGRSWRPLSYCIGHERQIRHSFGRVRQ